MAQVNGDCGQPSGAPLRPCGVWGDCRNNRGVIGSSFANTGVRGESNQTIGVYGTGRIYGVSGYSYGAGSDADPQVYAGVYAQGSDFGLYSEGAIGLYSRASSPGGIAGWFEGSIFASGSLVATGGKSAAVPHPDGTLRQLYAVESPESWFEDFGRAELSEGQAQVPLDEEFAALVDTSDYHVFLTPEGETSGLYVSGRTERDFEVREQGRGTSSVAFSYRIVARLRDLRTARLEALQPPPERTTAGRMPIDLEPEIEWTQENGQ
jgi:hypothetical protein